MNTIDITLHLPEELVKRATEAGILTGERIASLLETELERQIRVQRYAQTVQQIRALEPAITEEDVEAEIQAYRAEKAARKSASES